MGRFFSFFRWIQLSWFLDSLDSTCLVFLQSFLLLCGFVCCCVTTRCFWNTRWDVGFFSLDSIVLIWMFAGFNMWLIFFAFLLLLCCLVCCCATTRCWSVRQIFVPMRVSLHLKIILTGNYALPKFRWIQLSWFPYSLGSTCCSLFAYFLFVMWHCLLLCNYKMFLKHKVGCFFSSFRWIQLSWFLYSLDSTCFSLFAYVLVVMWLCLLLCNYKMLLKHKVGCFFSFFPGFNCLDLYFRWIEHVLVFLQIDTQSIDKLESADSTCCWFFVAFFSRFCCGLVCPSEFLCIWRLSL